MTNKITALPDSWGEVAKVGEGAFDSNQITTLPKSWGNFVKIGDYAFFDNFDPDASL